MLLCLIGLTFDACRYLQDNGNWEKAAWLAKLRLPENEYVENMEKIAKWLNKSLLTGGNNIEKAPKDIFLKVVDQFPQLRHWLTSWEKDVKKRIDTTIKQKVKGDARKQIL